MAEHTLDTEPLAMLRMVSAFLGFDWGMERKPVQMLALLEELLH